MIGVTGTVTYKGKPVANANVLCVGPGGITATGMTNELGQFAQLSTHQRGDGLVPGDYKVAITPPSTSSDANAPASYDAPPPPPFPAKYLAADTSELTITVTADGPRTFNLELKD